MLLCQDPINFQNGFSQIKILNMPKLKYNLACLDKYSLRLIWQFICIAFSESPNFHLPKIPLYLKHIQYNQQNHSSCERSESFLHTSYTWSTIKGKYSFSIRLIYYCCYLFKKMWITAVSSLANVGLQIYLP